MREPITARDAGCTIAREAQTPAARRCVSITAEETYAASLMAQPRAARRQAAPHVFDRRSRALDARAIREIPG